MSVGIQCVGSVGPYRTISLSRVIDPATEKRRCRLQRHRENVQGVEDYHTDIDIMSHLGTHVEAPLHHGELTKGVTDFPSDYFLGRGVLLKLETCAPRALIEQKDLVAADRDRIKPGDIVLLDSLYHSEPFAARHDDERPQLSRQAAEWFLEKHARIVGFGDGISIENDAEHCNAGHDILLGNDILFIEVLQNLDRLEEDTFLIVLMPLSIVGLDSSPVNVMAIEGIPGL